MVEGSSRGACVDAAVECACLRPSACLLVCLCANMRPFASARMHHPHPLPSYTFPNPICPCTYLCLLLPQIYEQTSHPKLGSALKSLGNVYLNKYRTDPEFRVAAENGPAHGADGDAALRTWVRAARTFERLGLTELESDYSWSCFDIGESRGDASA